MLETFQAWGMPKAVRSDNGEPFGVPTRDVIPLMSLWLKGWGVEPILNRPRRPQDNAHVENNQATVARWAEIHQCTSIGQMQQRIDEACRFQRDVYPVIRIGNVARKKVFVDLYHKARPFEQATFIENRAYDFLAQAIYPRKVSERGTISLYNKKFQAGLPYRRQVLFVKFNPEDCSWLCLDKDQNIVKVLSDQRLSKENLYNLQISQ